MTNPLVLEDLADFLFERIAEEADMAYRSVQVGNRGMRLVTFDRDNKIPVLIVHPERVSDDCWSKHRMICRAVRLVNQEKPDFNQYNVLIDLAYPYRNHPKFKHDWRIHI